MGTKSEKIDRLYEETKSLVRDGMHIRDACNRTGLSKHTYIFRRHKDPNPVKDTSKTRSSWQPDKEPDGPTITIHRADAVPNPVRPKRGSKESGRAASDFVIITTTEKLREVMEALK